MDNHCLVTSPKRFSSVPAWITKILNVHTGANMKHTIALFTFPAQPASGPYVNSSSNCEKSLKKLKLLTVYLQSVHLLPDWQHTASLSAHFSAGRYLLSPSPLFSNGHVPMTLAVSQFRGRNLCKVHLKTECVTVVRQGCPTSAFFYSFSHNSLHATDNYIPQSCVGRDHRSRMYRNRGVHCGFFLKTSYIFYCYSY